MVDAVEDSEKEQKSESETGKGFQGEERLKLLLMRLENVRRKIERSNLWVE